MFVKQSRIPHGNGWHTFVRGAIVPRSHFLRVLLGGYRAKIETWQSDDSADWDNKRRRSL